ncbi:MAG: hypothetical protein JSS81_18375 [Acidobacteria bacterium]|nr:hypothetical protein [Acidobacteriota bacterium]
MTREEAISQIETFFRRAGECHFSFYADRDYIVARIGEAFIGFEYDEADELLSAQALIHRFRREPADRMLDAVFGEETESNTGGGRLVFNSENLAFYLQRDFDEFLGDSVFDTEIGRLARAGLKWNAEIVKRAAEKASV